MVKYRKNDNWEFVIIDCAIDDINKDISTFFEYCIKYKNKNIDIIETETLKVNDQLITILVKFAIIN